MATKHHQVFVTANVPLLNFVSDARVSALRPLQVSDFGVVFTPTGLMLGKGVFFKTYIVAHRLIIHVVIALYSKSAGANAKHGSVTNSSSIAAVSNIAVQVFEQMFNRQFRAIPQAMAFFQTKQYALLPQISFISLLSSKPKVSPMTLELEQEDFDMFQKLQRGLACIKEAMQLF